MSTHWGPAIRLFAFFTLVTGVAYPILIRGIGQTLFAQQANGSLIERNGKVVGSKLIAQKFENKRYFWPRPSAVEYNPLPSGGSNFGPTSKDLKAKIEERRKAGLGRNLLFASASGLDPHISPMDALAQVPRIAEAYKTEKSKIIALIQSVTESRQFGFLGEPRVNVLMLNLALSEIVPQ